MHDILLAAATARYCAIEESPLTVRQFYSAAKEIECELIAQRRDFHRHPELAYQEVRTAAIVARQLGEIGMEVQTGVGKTGVVGLLGAERDGPTVLLRFDMDALPIQEENDTDYVSTQPGVMHACGHDGHTAIGLTVARMLAQQRDRLRGALKLVFQPAEEGGYGAAAMIADGALREPRPDFAFGLHLWNKRPFGWVGATEGEMMAGGREWGCVVSGDGGHAASPDQTHDPVVAAAQIVVALQTVVSRNVPPLESVVVSVTQINGGDTHNVIPGEVRLAGTLRYFRSAIRDSTKKRISDIAENVAAAMGCRSEVSFGSGYRPVSNDADAARLVRELAERVPGVTVVADDERTAGSEDFGEFMADIPGCFFFIGAANAARGLNYPHHHPRFDFDERSLTLGAALMASVAAHYVLPE
ncbi:MAG: M20 family metallopeptidase [Anaerolineales bacterium]|nr:M20 family metallopeptidase [Anaerolineales bacterium]HJO32969.1 M20 family metallopeptidase [Anaerolineales bacterium]